MSQWYRNIVRFGELCGKKANPLQIMERVGGWKTEMTMKDKDLLKLLQKNGWELVSIKGSHHKLKKDDDTIILPVHGADMKIGLLKKILKQASLDEQ